MPLRARLGILSSMSRGAAAAVGVLVVISSSGGTSAAPPDREPDTLPVPPVPVVASTTEIELPAVPSFELPLPEPGVHDVRALRVRGRALLGTELVVTGYVVWIYDCLTALAKPGMTFAEVQERIDDNPGLCERPKFALGASPTTSPEAALWIVDVPRPPNKREKIALTEVQLRARPRVPVIAIADFVAVTGTFALASPHGERNSDGLLVYRGLTHATPRARPAAPVIAARSRAAAPALARTRPLRAVVPVWKRNESIERYERCNQSLAAGRLDDAVAECRRALAMWNGNHLAWYALGNAHATREHWRASRDAYDHAAQLRPDQPMYQLYAGIARYKLAVREQRADEARPAADPDPAAPRATERHATLSTLVLEPYRLAMALSRKRLSRAAWFEPARQALTAAASIAPTLAAAHYYLGEIHREQDNPRVAAEAFTSALRADPSQPLAYIALAELYRSWDYFAQGLAVAQQGIAHTTAPVADLWYQLGMTHDALRHDVDAIAAFTRAIQGGNLQAQFQRGQIYVRRNDLASATRDLESFLASAAPSPALARQIATGLLLEIARKHDQSKASLPLPTRLDPRDQQRH
jgi:tetratricopeptide (TPR) repeat protein